VTPPIKVYAANPFMGTAGDGQFGWGGTLLKRYEKSEIFV
jgi:hypothetical protein